MLFVFGIFGGCGEPGPTSVTNEGTLCLLTEAPDPRSNFNPWTSDGPQTYAEDQPLTVYIEIRISDLVDSGFYVAANSEFICSVEVSGSAIRVESHGEWEYEECGGCEGRIRTTCESEPLPAGTYTLFHGDEVVRENIVIPSNPPQGCFL